MEGGTLFQVHFWWYPGDCSAQSPVSAPQKDHSDGKPPRVKELLRLDESVRDRFVCCFYFRKELVPLLDASVRDRFYYGGVEEMLTNCIDEVGGNDFGLAFAVFQWC